MFQIDGWNCPSHGHIIELSVVLFLTSPRELRVQSQLRTHVLSFIEFVTWDLSLSLFHLFELIVFAPTSKSFNCFWGTYFDIWCFSIQSSISISKFVVKRRSMNSLLSFSFISKFVSVFWTLTRFLFRLFNFLRIVQMFLPFMMAVAPWLSSSLSLNCFHTQLSMFIVSEDEHSPSFAIQQDGMIQTTFYGINSKN